METSTYIWLLLQFFLEVGKKGKKSIVPWTLLYAAYVTTSSSVSSDFPFFFPFPFESNFFFSFLLSLAVITIASSSHHHHSIHHHHPINHQISRPQSKLHRFCPFLPLIPPPFIPSRVSFWLHWLVLVARCSLSLSLLFAVLPVVIQRTSSLSPTPLFSSTACPFFLTLPTFKPPSPPPASS